MYKDVQKEVKNLYNITDNRAKFIARNEIGNLNAVTTKRRQEEAGIYCYEWRTSEDERVRVSHAELMGIFFFGMIVKLEKSMVEKFIRLQSYIQEWIIDVGALPFQLLI